MWAISLVAVLLVAVPKPAGEPTSVRPRSANELVYCDEDTVKRNVFKHAEATHFVVADFRPRSERPADVELGRTAANAVDQVLRDHMLRVALEGEEPDERLHAAKQLEVYRLRCIVKDSTAALALGKALGADLLLWGDAVCPLSSGRGQKLVNIITTLEARDHAQIHTGPIENHVTLPKEEVGSFCARAALTAQGWPLMGSAPQESHSASVLELGDLMLPQVVSGDALVLTLFVGGLNFYKRQDYSRALRLFRRASETLRTDSASASELLWAMGYTEVRAGRFDKGAEHFRHCESLAKENNDLWWRCRLLQIEAHSMAAQLPRAQALAQDALQRPRANEHLLTRAQLLQMLGNFALRTSDWKEARVRYEQALRLFQHLKDVHGEAHMRKSLGNLAWSVSDLKEAKVRYEEALLLFQDIGDTMGEAYTLKSLGGLALRASRWGEAQALCDKALPLFQGMGDKLGEAHTFKTLGDLALGVSDQKKAKARYNEALRLFREIGEKDGEARALLGLADVALRVSDKKTAMVRCEEALPLFRNVGSKDGEVTILLVLLLLAHGMGNDADFDKWLPQTRHAVEQSGDPRLKAQLNQKHGHNLARRGDKEQARKMLTDAHRLASESGDQQRAADVLKDLAALDTRVPAP